MTAKVKISARTVEEYLAAVEPQERTALEKLRKILHDEIPGAEECISYGVPALRLVRVVAGFGVSGSDCVFYPMNGATVAAFAEELSSYKTSKGSVRFSADRPLPVALVRKMVKASLLETGQG